MRRIEAPLLTREAFAAFGDVVIAERADITPVMVNFGTAARRNDAGRARLRGRWRGRRGLGRRRTPAVEAFVQHARRRRGRRCAPQVVKDALSADGRADEEGCKERGA